MSIMYYSKKLKKKIVNIICNSEEELFCVRLNIGGCDLAELQEIIDLMYYAWNIISCKRSCGYIKNYSGLLKRLFIRYNKENGMYYPFFFLLCFTSPKMKKPLELWKLQLKAYTSWFTAWASALKCCTDVSVTFDKVEKNSVEKYINYFCENKVMLNEIPEKELEVINNIISSKRIFSSRGIFYRLKELVIER